MDITNIRPSDAIYAVNAVIASYFLIAAYRRQDWSGVLLAVLLMVGMLARQFLVE